MINANINIIGRIRLMQPTGTVYDADVENWIDYIESQSQGLPTAGRLDKLNDLVLGWKNTTGSWATRVVIWVPYTDNNASFASRVNLKSPGNFTLNPVNSPTFANLSGWVCNGTNQYLDSGWDPSTNGASIYTAGDASIDCYIGNDIAASTKTAFGCSGASSAGGIYFVPTDNTDFVACRINSPTVWGYTDGTGTSVGYHKMRRTSTNTRHLFKNGSQVFTAGTAHTVTLTSQDLYVNAENNNGTPGSYSALRVGLLMLGSSNSGDEAGNDALWDTYIS